MNKIDRERFDLLWKTMMDIAGTNTGHPCKCQCANNLIEVAQDATKKENDLRWKATKTERCFGFHLHDMDRLFDGMERWNWRSKKHLSLEWKQLAESIRVSMDYSPFYGTADILHRWFGKWIKYKNMLAQSRPFLNGNKLVQILDEQKPPGQHKGMEGK